MSLVAWLLWGFEHPQMKKVGYSPFWSQLGRLHNNKKYIQTLPAEYFACPSIALNNQTVGGERAT